MEQKKEKQQIGEINAKIREGINHWADIMLLADADQWAVDLWYFPRDVANVTFIFQHVCCNIGIKNGHITEENAAEFGKRLRKLVEDMTSINLVDVVKGFKKMEE